MIDKDAFLAKYNIALDDFAATGLDWATMSGVHEDHLARTPALRDHAEYMQRRLASVEGVHSVRMRVKDPEHVVWKIIRKRIDGDVERTFSVATYRQEITDLIGLRLLHLFKDDWMRIHDAMMSMWNHHEDPFVNVRAGDLTSDFEARTLIVRHVKSGYRSVHYTVETRPATEDVIAEIQVRTLFEEAWSEIDHLIRYPHNQSDPLLSQFLLNFNRIAGTADEMGSYIKVLSAELENSRVEQARIREAGARELEEKAREISVLKTSVAQLQIQNAAEKQTLQDAVARLEARAAAEQTVFRDLGVRAAQNLAMNNAAVVSAVVNLASVTGPSGSFGQSLSPFSISVDDDHLIADVKGMAAPWDPANVKAREVRLQPARFVPEPWAGANAAGPQQPQSPPAAAAPLPEERSNKK